MIFFVALYFFIAGMTFMGGQCSTILPDWYATFRNLFLGLFWPVFWLAGIYLLITGEL